MKIPLVGVELFLADRRTDMTQLIVAFRNFAYAPKNERLMIKVVPTHTCSHTHTHTHTHISSPSSWITLQSNEDPRLLNGLHSVSSALLLLFPICNFAFINICLYTIPSPIHSLLLLRTMCVHSKLLSSLSTPRCIPLSLTLPRPQLWFPKSKLLFLR